MSTDNNNVNNDNVSNTQRMIGQVKWFNNKAGYGFITLSEGEYAGKDIFAHYTTIGLDDSQYKYLVQGEYVEFQLSVSTNTSHEFQATHISGIKGGMLMCETRLTNRPPRREREHAVASTGHAVHAEGATETKKSRPVPKKRITDKPLKPVDMDGFKMVTKKRSAN